MANLEVQRLTEEWERNSRALAKIFEPLIETRTFSLMNEKELHTIYPYKQKNGSSIDLIVRPVWKAGWQSVDSLLELYQKYIEYTKGPGKDRDYYAFIEDAPGRERGYWFNEKGLLEIEGEFFSYITPFDITFDGIPEGAKAPFQSSPFCASEKPRQMIIGHLNYEYKREIERELDSPQLIRTNPQLYNLLKQTEIK